MYSALALTRVFTYKRVVVVFSCYFFDSLTRVFTYKRVTSRFFGVFWLTYMKVVGEIFSCFASFSDWNDTFKSQNFRLRRRILFTVVNQVLANFHDHVSVPKVNSHPISSRACLPEVGSASWMIKFSIRGRNQAARFPEHDREVFVGFSTLFMAIGFMILCCRHDVESRTGLFRTRNE